MSKSEVVVLRQDERVRHNSVPILSLYRDLGADSADQVVARALAEIGLTLAGLAAQLEGQDFDGLDRQFRRLQQMAENLGLVTFGTVCRDARQCLDRGDATAFAAVWSRLGRVAERSLAPKVHFADQSL